MGSHGPDHLWLRLLEAAAAEGLDPAAQGHRPLPVVATLDVGQRNKGQLQVPLPNRTWRTTA